MQKKKNKKKPEILTLLPRLLALYMAAVAAIIVPLYIKKEGYLRLIGTKARIFLVFTLPAVAAAVILIIVSVLKDHLTRGKEMVPQPLHAARLSLTEKRFSTALLIAVAGWSLFSTLLSEAPLSSFLGKIGWSVGSLMITTLIFCTIWYSHYFDFSQRLLLPLIVENTVIFIFALLQSADRDPFGFLHLIRKVYRYSYLGTIGQKNCFSGYLCLLLPLFWCMFAEAEDLRHTLLYGAFCTIGFMAIIAANSDSTFAGIGVSVFFLLPYFLFHKTRIRRASILISLFGACLLLFRILPFFEGKVIHIMRHSHDVSAVLLRIPCSVGLILLGGLLYVFIDKWVGKDYEKRARLLLIVFEALFSVAVIVVVLRSATGFNDKWGTNRGYIWRVGWEHFVSFPLKEKLVGVGPDLLAPVYVELRLLLKTNVVAAHSEPLQVLLTQGIIGLSLYLVFWGYLVYLFVRKQLWKTEEGKFFFPLATYLGQSLFCSVYPVTAVLFSLMEGLYLREVES